MKRRDFIRKMAVCGAGALLLPELFFCEAAKAASQADEGLQGVDVRPVDLSFGPLVSRFRTDAVVLHHIGGTDEDVSAETVHRWHLDNGWSGIGYHFLIRKDGTVEQGRPLNMMGAHCYGENSHTVGINIVGDFTWAQPEETQLESAASLVAAVCTYYGFPPAESSVLGHCDLLATACPGGNLYERLPEIVATAAELYVPGRAKWRQTEDRPLPEREMRPEDELNSRDRRHGARSVMRERGGGRGAVPMVPKAQR